MEEENSNVRFFVVFFFNTLSILSSVNRYIRQNSKSNHFEFKATSQTIFSCASVPFRFFAVPKMFLVRCFLFFLSLTYFLSSLCQNLLIPDQLYLLRSKTYLKIKYLTQCYRAYTTISHTTLHAHHGVHTQDLRTAGGFPTDHTFLSRTTATPTNRLHTIRRLSIIINLLKFLLLALAARSCLLLVVLAISGHHQHCLRRSCWLLGCWCLRSQQYQFQQCVLSPSALLRIVSRRRFYSSTASETMRSDNFKRTYSISRAASGGRRDTIVSRKVLLENFFCGI